MLNSYAFQSLITRTQIVIFAPTLKDARVIANDAHSDMKIRYIGKNVQKYDPLYLYRRKINNT